MATHLKFSRLIFKYFFFKQCVFYRSLFLPVPFPVRSFAIFVKCTKFNLCFHIDSDFKNQRKYLLFRFMMMMFYKCKQF